jgi:hypothetical protein
MQHHNLIRNDHQSPATNPNYTSMPGCWHNCRMHRYVEPELDPVLHHAYCISTGMERGNKSLSASWLQ